MDPFFSPCLKGFGPGLRIVPRPWLLVLLLWGREAGSAPRLPLLLLGVPPRPRLPLLSPPTPHARMLARTLSRAL